MIFWSMGITSLPKKVPCMTPPRPVPPKRNLRSLIEGLFVGLSLAALVFVVSLYFRERIEVYPAVPPEIKDLLSGDGYLVASGPDGSILLSLSVKRDPYCKNGDRAGLITTPLGQNIGLCWHVHGSLMFAAAQNGAGLVIPLERFTPYEIPAEHGSSGKEGSSPRQGTL
jgi:hypothetical protein